MAELTIRLRTDPETGKKDILVSLSSDEDALPLEHEQQHRELVDQLVEGGLLSAGEAGKVIIDREEESAPTAPQKTEEPAERQAESQSG